MSHLNADSQAEEAAAFYKDSIHGKTILLTGVSPSSLAATAATSIALYEPRLIILASRNTGKIAEVEKAVKAIAPKVAVRLLELDLNSFAAVKKAAQEVMAYPEPLDILINSAGIMANAYTKTADGLESQFQTNHAGPFLFTQSILPKLLASKGRVVNVTSSGHAAMPPYFEDMSYRDGEAYNRWLGYATSKAANVLYASALADRYGSQGLTAFSVHPGAATTGIFGALGPEEYDLFVQMGAMTPGPEYKPIKGGNPAITWKTPSGCAAGLVTAACAPQFAKHNGAYVVDCQIADDQRAEWTVGREKNDALWTLTERVIGSA